MTKTNSNFNGALSSKQVVALIKSVGPKRTVLVEGLAGIGKTSIHYALAKDPAFADFHIPRPIDCTQLSDGSVWMPDIDGVRGVSRELPNERFGLSEENHAGIPGAKKSLICLDELAKTRQFIKDVLAPIVYERRVGNYKFPEGSIVFGCTNLSEEGLGDSIQAHLRNRLVIVTMRPPTKDEWVNDFAVPNSLNENVIAAVSQYPAVFESFMDYRKGGQHEGKKQAAENPYIFDPSNAAQKQFVSPRSLHAASDIIDQRGNMDMATLESALGGTVGPAFAANLATMIAFGDELPAFDAVMNDPKNTPLPKNTMGCVVQVFQFIKLVKDRQQAEAAGMYVERMREEMKSLFVNAICSNNQAVNAFCVSSTFDKLLRANREFLN